MYPENERSRMAMSKSKRKIHFDISFWVAVSAVAVLGVILMIVAAAHFQWQRDKAVALFVEKGATLINSFEAGFRNTADKKNRLFYLQKLLTATAQQPDIDYLIVANRQGFVIADSDPSMVGQRYGLDLDLIQLASSRTMMWRQTENPEGADTFEVYRGFSSAYADDPANQKEMGHREDELIIFVGFNMEKIEKAAAEDTRNAIILILILLLTGASAIVSLYLVWDYRLTRTSLARMKAFSETLVGNMPIGLMALDNHGKIIRCNEIAERILKLNCSATSGAQNEDVLPDALKDLLGELPPKGGLLERDLEVNVPETGKRTLETVAAGLMDGNESAGRMLLIRDVTGIREMEKEVVRSRHLSSISSLAAGVAHEIRNPLSSIKGFAVYLKERLAADDEDQKTADIIIEEVERLNRVITQLIEFARPLELKKEKTNLADLIGHAEKLIEGEARKKNIAVSVNAADDLVPVDVDPDRVKQVLLNIFLNAAAAMKDGGRLEIALRREKDNIILDVVDNGAGIAATDLSRIYDPYFTSKPAGTGLGLAVVQKIMEAHGGRIIVESDEGKGTRVSLSFPIAKK